MRKLRESGLCEGPDGAHLQCGRIYKDAEIGQYAVVELAEYTDLQCGRIYKDAEI